MPLLICLIAADIKKFCINILLYLFSMIASFFQSFLKLRDIALSDNAKVNVFFWEFMRKMGINHQAFILFNHSKQRFYNLSFIYNDCFSFSIIAFSKTIILDKGIYIDVGRMQLFCQSLC